MTALEFAQAPRSAAIVRLVQFAAIHCTIVPTKQKKSQEEALSKIAKLASVLALIALSAAAAPAAGAWIPTKPIEFIATAGPGGGTDNFARAVQSIIVKYKMTDQPIVVVNKPGGSGAEGYTYAKAAPGDPYRVVFGTSMPGSSRWCRRWPSSTPTSRDRGDGSG